MPALRVVLASAGIASLLLIAGCAAAEPSPVGLTAAERASVTRNVLNERWAAASDGAPGFLEPRVAVIRYTTWVDGGETIAACLRGSGYPKSIATAGGVIDVTLTPPEAFPFSVAKFRCESKYPEDPVELGYMSASQEEFLYHYWRDEAVPCLRAQGARVADLPDFGPAGVSSLGTIRLIDLNPFLQAKPPSGASVALLETRCPRFPAELYDR